MTTTIPKIIHFIWAGGEKIMPDETIRNVLEWAKANPEFVVKIWVDPLTDRDVFTKYHTKFQELDSSKKFQDIIDKIQVTNINQDGIISPEIRYEIDHLSPNYGASSDMLRYNILFKEGGAYFDCGDVYQNPHVRLGDIVFLKGDQDEGKNVFDSALSGPRLLVHVTPHVMHDSLRMEKDKEAPGTEAIICSPGHSLMQGIAEAAAAAYHGKGWNYKLLQYTHDYTDPKTKAGNSPKANIGKMPLLLPAVLSLQASGTASEGTRKDRLSLFAEVHKESVKSSDQYEVAKRRALDTLNLTGPGMAITYLKNTLNVKELSPAYLMPQTKEKRQDWVSLPKDHTLAWAAFRVVPKNFEEAVATAIKSINFEVNEMKIFNFSAHVEQVTGSVEAARKAGKDPGIDYDSIASLKAKVNVALVGRLSKDGRFAAVGGKLIQRILLSQIPRPQA